MKLLVLSDSHGRSDRISEAVKRRRNLTDCIIHLGDGASDIRFCTAHTEGIPIVYVRGNHEEALHVFASGDDHASELLLDLDGYKVLIMHGHKFGVKGGYDRAAEYAYARGADILMFGHTHIPYQKYLPEGSVVGNTLTERPFYLFNPGSVAERSAGVVELLGCGISMNHFIIE